MTVLYDIITKELQFYAISLESIGVNNYAWNKDHIDDVINFCYCNNIIILGGDVIERQNSHINLTYNNWFIKNDEDFNPESSCLYTKEYVYNIIEVSKNKDLYFEIIIRIA